MTTIGSAALRVEHILTPTILRLENIKDRLDEVPCDELHEAVIDSLLTIAKSLKQISSH